MPRAIKPEPSRMKCQEEISVPTNTERLIAYHLARLDDKRLETRAKAVEELILLGAPEVLDAPQAIKFHLIRLNDARPEIRIDAIKGLEALTAAEALDTLKAIYDSDSAVEVRKAAQDAGRAIFLKLKTAQR